MVESAPEPSEADSWQTQAACAAAEAEAAHGGSAGLAEAVREVPEAPSGPAEAAPVLLTHEDASSEQRHHAELAAFDCVEDDLGPTEAADSFDEFDWHSAEAVL
jgi:hypothetical protein